jgi:O-succinylbenzoic acid--CoA ligase
MLAQDRIFPWPLPDADSPRPFFASAPHMRPWADSVADFLIGEIPPGCIAFATSGSSGGSPKAILFTRDALECNALGAIQHMGADHGDWCCPLPAWHVGGAMTYIRAAIAGTHVHAYTGKWNARDYTDFLGQCGAAWTSLVPTQVVDIVQDGITAPPGLACVLVGGGSLSQANGLRARELGWPVVQSYGMTEAGSQIATASPSDPFHTDRLTILPHWEVRESEDGRLSLRGEGRFFGVVTENRMGGFSLRTISPREWWTNNDIVEIHGNTLTFVRRADRLVKILGELVDPDALELSMSGMCPGVVVESLPCSRRGAMLVACHPDAAALRKAADQWNTFAPGFQRLSRLAVMDVPRNPMGKIDRNSLRILLSSKEAPLERISN